MGSFGNFQLFLVRNYDINTFLSGFRVQYGNLPALNADTLC